MTDESKRSAKIQSTSDSALPHQPRVGGPAWEGTVLRETPAVPTEDYGNDDARAISATTDGMDQLSRNIGSGTSSRDAQNSLACVDHLPNEEVGGSYANTSGYEPLLRRQVSHLDEAETVENCAGHERETLELADVTAAMRKAIGLTAGDSPSCDSSDGSGLERRRDDQPDLHSKVFAVKDSSMANVKNFSDGFQPLAAVGMVAGNLKEKGEEKRTLQLDDRTSQGKSQDNVSGSALVRRAPSAKTRHDDFVGAVKDALRHIDIPLSARDRAESSLPTESLRLHPPCIQHVARDHIAQSVSTCPGGERANSRDLNTIGTPGVSQSAALVTVPSSSTTCAVPMANLIHSAKKKCWVRYLSPEGYPYLYNASTGESEWMVPGEDEKLKGEECQQSADGKVTTKVLGRKHNEITGALNQLSVEVSMRETVGVANNTTRSTAGIPDADSR